MPEPVEELIRRLKLRVKKRSRTSNRPGASLEALAEFEARHGVVQPTDFREYLLIIEGMNEDQSLDYMSRFWPLADIMTVREYIALEMPQYGLEPPPWSDDHDAFFDFSISSYAHVIRLSADPNQPTPVFTWRFDGEIFPVAPSFAGFLGLYLNDPCPPATSGLDVDLKSPAGL